MMHRRVRNLEFTLAILLALYAADARPSDAPAVAEVLGFAAGVAIPVEHRRYDDAHKTIRTVTYPGKAGFDRIEVGYTANQGVCYVKGFVDVDHPSTDVNGRKHQIVADVLIERVKKKLGGKTPTSRFDYNHDPKWEHDPERKLEEWPDALRRGHVGYAAAWSGDAVKPYDHVSITVEFGSVEVKFEMPNIGLCHVEQIATYAAEF